MPDSPANIIHTPVPRRRFYLSFAIGSVLLFIAFAGAYRAWSVYHVLPTIRLGLLHSKTGAMAVAESGMIDGELLAVAEINARGGIHGRRVEAIVADGRSDEQIFAEEAERLITEEKVATVIGCWTSACRKTVRPVFEQHRHLLVYPMAYEGLEASPNIIYVGAAPNQQVLPALKWGLDTRGRRVFLVGSDYVWPHAVNAIIKDGLKSLGGQLVGEEYISYGSSKVNRAVAAIIAARPDIIFSAIAGESNAPFYHALRAAGIEVNKMTPVMSFSLGENQIQSFPRKDVTGQFIAFNYFQSIDSPINKAFVERFRKRYGATRLTSDAAETGYFAVYLWAQAVRSTDSTEAEMIRDAMLRQSFEAPEGIVSVDAETHHTWRPVSIGQIDSKGQVDVVWSANRPIRPEPYPRTRTPAQWEAFLSDLYARWDHSWSNPVEHE